MDVTKMLMPLLKMVQGELKDIEPENNIAEFIKERIGILFETNVEIGMDMTMINEIIRGVFVAEANNDPVWTLSKIQRFNDALMMWYSQQRRKKQNVDQKDEL